MFTGNLADYTINFTPDAQGFITVTDNVGTDGTDRLRNIERLQFADVTIGGTNNVPTGTVVVNGTAQVGQVLTADPAAIVDADGIASPFSYQWQYRDPGRSRRHDPVGRYPGATGVTFAPTDFYVGNALRVVASFIDGQGFTERLFSAPTAALVFDPAVNHAPTVVTQVAEPGLFDTTAQQDQPITLSLPLVTTFTDDQTPAANLIYTATLADGIGARDGRASASPPRRTALAASPAASSPARRPRASSAPSTSASRQPMHRDLPSPTPSPSMCCRPMASRLARPPWVPLLSRSTSALSSTASIWNSFCSRS